MMKAVTVLLLAVATAALPSESRLRSLRAQIGEPCSIGYCLQNGGTTGGGCAKPTVVTNLAQLKEAASRSGSAVIVVSGEISAPVDKISISSNKTIFGEPGSVIRGISLEIKRASNVILRNLKIERVLYEAGDAISLNVATNVWIDHVDASGDLTAPKEDYDGLLDITHASDWITVSNSYFHNHWKATLIGHADSNGAEDEGKLHVTFANNYWHNLDSRVPSVRFGTIHSINNFFNGIGLSGINARQKSQILLQSSVFRESTDTAIYSDGSDYLGYVVVDDVDLGGSTNSAGPGTLTPDTLPYPSIEALGSAAVPNLLPESVGQLL
ncbi:putative pectate lyase B [Paramyrothecium foliicola]|nr:putative pectate lyase B [Paramyrothecium foliicola]